MTESDREEQKMKVVKFGGSSMADAGQYRKVRDILLADPERRSWWSPPQASGSAMTIS